MYSVSPLRAVWYILHCRWEVIAQFVHDHAKGGDRPKTPKQVFDHIAALLKLL